MDQHRDARDRRQQLLRFEQPGSVPHLDPARELAPLVLVGFVGGDEHLGHSAGLQHACHLPDRQLALRVLTSGHRHRAVVEQLVGDVHPGGTGRLDRQLATVEVGAVAEVLDQVIALDEVGHADPLGALVAHAGDACDVADSVVVHEQRHGVATDPGPDQRSFGHLGAAVVRTSRAVIRRAGGPNVDGDPLTLWLLRDQPVTDPLGQHPTQRPDDEVGVEVPIGTEQRRPMGVVLAEDRGPVRRGIQALGDQRLDERLLLLDHHQGVDPASEGPDRLGVERDRHLHTEQPNTGSGDVVVAGEPEPSQCFTQLSIRDARRCDADPRVGRIDRGGVQIVLRCVADRQWVADVVDLLLELDGVRRQQSAARLPSRGLVETVGGDRLDSVGSEVDRGHAVGDVGHDLDRRPQPTEPRQGHGVAPQIEHLGRVTRVEQRHVHVGDHTGRRRRDRRALRVRIVAHQRDGATPT